MAEQANRRRRGKAGNRNTGKSTGVAVYDKMRKYLASKNQLDRNGYPRVSPASGQARFSCDPPKLPFNDSDTKVCVRCDQKFTLKQSGKRYEDQCVYHYGRCYSDIWQCCEARRGEEGCMTCDTHVHDDNVRDTAGYVKTSVKPLPFGANPGIYAIDCEMSYTMDGLELTRVSVVDHNFRTVYDSFVKPHGEILSYNTEHSGVMEKNLEGVTTTLEDVQKYMLETFSADTILIGHSLESDLVALRLIHDTVIDTSLVFTHPKGHPYKFRLRTLARKHLGKTVQVGGHDSVEDAFTCMEIITNRIGT